jgi:hypothetical protein
MSVGPFLQLAPRDEFIIFSPQTRSVTNKTLCHTPSPATPSGCPIPFCNDELWEEARRKERDKIQTSM